MKPKSLMLLALAGGCGLIASIGISQVMDAKQSAGPTLATQPIYVAVHNINLGDPIDETMVSLEEWPKDRVPPGAIANLEDLEGRRPRTAIIQGEPILDAKLLATGEFADPIAQLPEGYRLSTISVDAEKSAAGLLSPGDRVDVQLFVNRNERAGISEPMTKVILQNIRVYAVESAVQRTADGNESRAIPKTVSLVVTPKQASEIDLAQNLGNVSLIPRSPNDEESVAAVEVTAGTLLGGDAGRKNTRQGEQNRDAVSEAPRVGFVAGLMGMLRSATENRPPFEMEVLLADERQVLRFDPTSGKLLSSDGGQGSGAGTPGPPGPGSQQPPSGPGAKPAEWGEAGGVDADEPGFPIDFGDAR